MEDGRRRPIWLFRVLACAGAEKKDGTLLLDRARQGWRNINHLGILELPRFDGHLSAWDLPRALLIDCL